MENFITYEPEHDKTIYVPGGYKIDIAGFVMHRLNYVSLRENFIQ